jgi:hypothetical protein
MAITVGALPAGVDVALYAGDDFEMTVKVSDANGNPVILTGTTPKSEIRATQAATVVLATFTVTTVDPSTYKLTLTGAITAALPASAVWDLQVTDATSKVTTLAAGKVKVTAEVTR